MSRTAEITMGLLLFAGTFVLAGVQGWSASDLMWGLWISSLTLGYATIVLSIVGPLAIGEPSRILRSKPREKKSSLPRRSATPPLHPQIAYLFFVPIAVFMLGFFTVHFYAGLGDYVLYAAMILYFFPFGVLFRGRKQRARTDDDGLVESTLARWG